MDASSRSRVIAHHVHKSAMRDATAEQPQQWHNFPELPLAAELMADEPPELPELVEMRPVSKYDYLEAQYLLHRYEATEMLRRAIVRFREHSAVLEDDQVSIFTDVYVRGLVLTRAGPASRIILSPKRSQPERPGSQANRLIPGSLVALTPRSDCFRTKCFVATVANRMDGVDARPPVIELFWADQSEAVVDPTLELVMLEPNGQYFESIRHTMTGLQHAATTDSGFDKYIHQAGTRHRPAAYLRETPYNAAVVPDNAQQLDPSQLEALKLATSQELAVIQGPPGTGKTFTSIVVIESYVCTLAMIGRNRVDGSNDPITPIIVAAQTNHAVDQILERCVKLEIGSVARLGRRSQVEVMDERNLSNIVRRSKASRHDGGVEAALRSLRGQLKELVQQCLPKGLLKADDLYGLGIITENQFDSLTQDDWETDVVEEEGEDLQSHMSKWLDEYVQQRDYQKATQLDADTQAGAGPAQDFLEIDMTRPDCILRALHRDDGDVWWHRAERLLSRHADLYQIKPTERGAVYCYLYKSLFAKVTAQIQALLGRYQEACNRLKTVRWDNNIRALLADGVQILGCTTTGLVKYRGMLAAMKPRILLVEEAAETREANIAAALFPSLEQLVLVGDHQQLVPHADMQELGHSPHCLTVSLFQRLVNIKVPYSALRVQRRMIPAIRQVVQVFYPDLEDHEVVKDPERRPPVPGMGGCNLWWFQHKWVQSRGDGGFSYSNHKEAAMIVGFARYLVQSGVDPEQITVLAYYTGQVELVKSKMKQDSCLGAVDTEWSVRTIDGFQGEENDIILLSLVRGPDNRGKARPGFVADENRAVVATSRAKRGFYVFGNSQNVLGGNSRSRQTWAKVVGAFRGRMASHLPLACAVHGTETKVFQPEDWRLVPANGCHKSCGEGLLKAPAPITVPAALPTSSLSSCGSGQAPSNAASMADVVKSAMRYQTSDELMEGGMRRLFAKYEAASEANDDMDVSNSDSDCGLLISLEPE